MIKFAGMKHAGLLLVCLLMSVSSVRSQWVPNDGLYSSTVGSIVSHRGALYAGGNPGLFRSTDFGMNWIAVASRRTGNNLQIAASDSSLFVCTPKVIRTTDAGATWKTLTVPGGDTLVAEKIYTVDNLLIAATAKNGLFRSLDDGTTWKAATDSLRAYDIVTAFGKLYAGSDSGVYVSADGGMNWERIGPGSIPVLSIAATNGYLFACSKDNFYRSPDSGQTWEELYALANNQRVAVLDTALYVFTGWSGGVFRSDDNGTNWKIIDTTLYTSINCMRLIDGRIFIGTTTRGVFRLSAASQPKWQPCQMTDHRVTAFLRVDSILYAGTKSHIGILGSVDSGKSWFDRSKGYAKSPGFTYPAIQLLIAHDGALFAHDLYSGTFRSTNGGALWQPIESQLVINSSQLGSPVALVSRDSTLFGTKRGGTPPFGLLRSNDLGKSWQLSDSLKIGPKAIASLDGALFVGTSDNRNRLLRSTDDGATWPLLNSFPWSRVIDLATSGSVLYATAEHGDFMMLYSSDGGDSWEKIRLPLRIDADSLYSFYVTNESNIYLAFNKGLYFSPNQGVSWKQVGEGLPNNTARSVIVDGEYLIAGNSNGIWRRPLGEVIGPVSADIELEIDQRLSKIAPDGTVTLVATITNNTPNILINVTLRDTISGLQRISQSTTKTGVNASDSMITATIPLLASGEQVVYTSVGKLLAEGVHRRRPIVEPSGIELAPENNFDLFEVYWGGGASVKRLPFDDAQITHVSKNIIRVSRLTGQHITARMYNILGQLISTHTFGSVQNSDIELQLPVDVTVLELYDGTLPIMKRIEHWH